MLLSVELTPDNTMHLLETVVQCGTRGTHQFGPKRFLKLCGLVRVDSQQVNNCVTEMRLHFPAIHFVFFARHTSSSSFSSENRTITTEADSLFQLNELKCWMRICGCHCTIYFHWYVSVNNISNQDLSRLHGAGGIKSLPQKYSYSPVILNVLINNLAPGLSLETI